MSRGNGHPQLRLRTNSFTNDPMRNKFRPPQSAEKLFEKYTSLAKEAMSSGDKTLSENYLQHADHFVRIIEEKNKRIEIRMGKTGCYLQDKRRTKIKAGNR